ncbi:MAG TPA: DUF2520 domain-containing protein [Ignavibacteria bacterium]|nr:DUF2520 domain-containing protein [Ignavibacteria bacterium]
MNILLIGAGNTGGNLLPILKKKFKKITIVNRNKKTNRELNRLYSAEVFENLNDVLIRNYDCYILCVQDKFIKSVFKKISGAEKNFKNKYFIHLSGSLSSDIFHSDKINKTNIISAHPIQSFAGIQKNGDKLFKNITIGIDGGANATKLIYYIFSDYNINYVKINSKDKILYHLASVIASNFLVTQFHLIQKILNKIGLKDSKSFDIFEEIINTTINNIKTKGIKNSLTGPVKRGDIRTIKLHKEEIKKRIPEIANYYKILTDFTNELK